MIGNWGWLMQFKNRSEMRKKYDIVGDKWEDCGTVFFCQGCAIIQEEKESLHRKKKAEVDAITKKQYQRPSDMDPHPTTIQVSIG
jgi:hypothetical protein